MQTGLCANSRDEKGVPSPALFDQPARQNFKEDGAALQHVDLCLPLAQACACLSAPLPCWREVRTTIIAKRIPPTPQHAVHASGSTTAACIVWRRNEMFRAHS
jgi:hypothetical protein